MSILDDADPTPDRASDDGDADGTPTQDRDVGTSASIVDDADSFETQIRGSTVEISGEGEVAIARPETKQPDDKSGNWLSGTNAKGRPRGVEAAKQRSIVQTASMQSIVNGIVDQLLGGELTFIDDEDAMDDLTPAEQEAAGDFKQVLRDVLTGPHMGDEDLDDLVTAAVEDMLGPGNAYLQLLGSESGAVPVASLTTLDPLTIRHNVDEHGFPLDPPYWQVSGGYGTNILSSSGRDPTPLQADDLAVLRYPKGNRSYRTYPVSAAWQVKEWLEILADSVTHHKRYYSDNEVPPGLMQIVDASDSTIQDIQAQVEQAAGDPRDFPIVGGEAPAQWVEMGGTAINLDVISEQQWFFEMCLGSLGLGKSEVGMIEDTNRANGKIEAERVYKRVAGPFGKQFEQAMLHVARQFDVFTELGEPFTPTLAYTDPRAERAEQEQLRKEYEAGKLTLRQYVRRAGDPEVADDDDRFTVDVGGQTVDYGSHPKWVAQRLMSQLGATDPEGTPDAGEGDDAEGD